MSFAKRWIALGLAACTLGGCSLRSMATARAADALASGGAAGGVFGSDEDPELIRDAAPFSLKAMEALLAEQPEHEGLLLAACSGFTQYAYAFPATDADLVEGDDYARAEALRERARKLFVRGRDYCLRSLEARHPGVRAALLRAPDEALARTTAADVPLLYWTGASWGSAISLGLDHPELVADFPAARALLLRALALDEDWERGAIHGALVSVESVPEAMGGSRARARAHFERAVALSGGTSASPYVTYAASVARPEGDREAFVALLEQALAVDPAADPGQRLANEIAQRRARHLLARVDALFVGGAGEGDS